MYLWLKKSWRFLGNVHVCVPDFVSFNHGRLFLGFLFSFYSATSFICSFVQVGVERCWDSFRVETSSRRQRRAVPWSAGEISLQLSHASSKRQKHSRPIFSSFFFFISPSSSLFNRFSFFVAVGKEEYREGKRTTRPCREELAPCCIIGMLARPSPV